METVKSKYYNYDFTSIGPTLALIKEELRSYYDTGAIDDSVWSVYVNKCLRKLGRGNFPIKDNIITLCEYNGVLPENFHSVREAWLVTDVNDSYTHPSAVYQEYSTSSLLNPPSTYCFSCAECVPQLIKVAYKTTNSIVTSYQKHYLLKPGNISTLSYCSKDCKNTMHSSGAESFDIRDGKFISSFRTGVVYMAYYANEYDNDGYQMVPDNYRILEYIEAFIKQKIFEQLSNQTVDESYNQIASKAQQYKQMADEAFIMAYTEGKKQTTSKKIDAIKKTSTSLNRFILR